jgi:hypothetical protein
MLDCVRCLIDDLRKVLLLFRREAREHVTDRVVPTSPDTDAQPRDLLAVQLVKD